MLDVLLFKGVIIILKIYSARACVRDEKSFDLELTFAMCLATEH